MRTIPLPRAREEQDPSDFPIHPRMLCHRIRSASGCGRPWMVLLGLSTLVNVLLSLHCEPPSQHVQSRPQSGSKLQLLGDRNVPRGSLGPEARGSWQSLKGSFESR